MRSKAIAILGICTVLAVIAAGWSVYWRATSHALPPAPASLFPGLLDKVNDVAKIQVATANGSFTVVKGSGDAWSMVEKGGYPVTYETVKQVVVGLANLRPLEAKTARPERFGKIKLVDPGKQGPADDKGVLVRLVDQSDKELAALIVGKTRSIQTKDRDGWYYVRKPAEAQTWLASARLEVWEKPTSWLDSETVRIERKRIRAAANQRPNGDTVEISRPNPEKTDFTVDNLPEGEKMIHDTVANGFASALGYLSFEDVARADTIDFSDSIDATYRTFDGLVVTVQVAEVGDKHWAHFAAAFDPAEVHLDALSETDKKKMKSEQEVRAEAERINQRFGAWAYDVPQYKATDLTVPMSRLAAPEKPGSS